MKINVYPIVSSLHNQHVVDEMNLTLDPLRKKGCEFAFVDNAENLYKDCDLAVILVQSGGSENLFLKAFGQLKEPYYLLTYGANNSLAASLEIMSFLVRHGLKGEVLHGSEDYLLQRFEALASKKSTAPKKYRLGVLGHPSDWLIASDVDYSKVQDLFGIELVDLPISEVREAYEKEPEELDESLHVGTFNRAEIVKAYRLFKALEKIVAKHELNGFTIRCFDLLGSLKTTACLALALFNSRKDAIGTCEGDIPSMISMALAKYDLHTEAFQCNPSRIDVEKNQIVLAHCTLPLTMCEDYVFDTHFESGIGVGIHGEIKEGDVTLFRVNADLTEFFVEEGTLEKDMYERHLCRTQIVLTLPHLDALLTHPLGNHEIVIKGHRAKEIIDILSAKGLKRI